MSRRKLELLWAGLVAAATTALAAPAQAQVPLYDNTQRLPALGRSVAGTDDSTALVQNPANLAFLPDSEFRWTSIYLKEKSAVPWEGHALALAFPLPFGLATGLRADFVRPPTSSPGLQGSRPYQWITWGLALGDEAFATGFSYQRSFSETTARDALASWSFSMSSRGTDYLGISLVANDLNGPSNSLGGRISPSYDIAAALRPLGTQALEVGLETKYVKDEDVWIPRATLGIDLPNIGRFTGGVAARGIDDEPDWIFSAGLALVTNNPVGSTELQGGIVTGDGLREEAINPHFDVAFKGFREPAGAEVPRYAVRLRIESTPGSRSHVALLRNLWKLADEPNVDALVVELRTRPAKSYAQLQELRDAFFHLRRRGKRVLCHLEDNGGGALYLCSAASRTLINPAGGLRFAGLKSRGTYLARLLKKLGVRADFVRIGKHKSAPERLTRRRATDQARKDRIDLLQQLERQLVQGVATGRRRSPKQVRKSFMKGPFIAKEARAHKLVDGYAFDDQLEKKVSVLVGRSTPLLEDVPGPRRSERFGTRQGIAIVYVSGDMVDGRSQNIPFLGMKLAGSYTIAEALKSARESPNIGAVVLRIETGGGSAMAADVIWRQVQLTEKVKPVVVSMGSAAASAGYYIAAPATEIFANPGSITGSIGVFYGKADIAGLLDKIGVDVETHRTAPRADAESIYRPFTAAERKELERKVAQFYDTFLTRVSKGRKLSKADVDKVGRGRVWTGEQARDRKLVDQLGGLRQALDRARELANLHEEAPIVELPKLETSILGLLLGVEGLKADADLKLPPEVLRIAQQLAPFMVYSADKPLMRIELTPVVP